MTLLPTGGHRRSRRWGEAIMPAGKRKPLESSRRDALDEPAGALVEINGKLRHDRWKDKQSQRWTGKVFIAVDPGEGTIRSKGIAPDAQREPALAA